MDDPLKRIVNNILGTKKHDDDDDDDECCC